MKSFTRKDPLFSLCGLNCGLCSMKLGGHCGGCGFGNQSCKIARCSLEHGGMEYCFQCEKYPCARYQQADCYDLFITCQHRLADLEKAKRMGPEAYGREQAKKTALLADLLERYNDGRRKTLYCLAVNLLETDEVKGAVQQLEQTPELAAAGSKEKAAFLAERFHALAEGKDILLKLRKKPEKT